MLTEDKKQEKSSKYGHTALTTKNYNKIRETYSDEESRYRREYEAAIKYFRELAKIAKESEAQNDE